METTIVQLLSLPSAKHRAFTSNFARAIWCLLIGCGISLAASAKTTETISAGSFIVNMGITPQNDGKVLKPYGMLHDLLRNHKVPIRRVISPSKGRDGIDFSHNGSDYRGGTFIIPAKFHTATINRRVSTPQGQCVVGATSVSAITVPVHGTLEPVLRWVLNPDTYNVTVTDANGCTAMRTLTLTNINPNPVQPGAINNN